MAQGSARFAALALGLACAGCGIAPAPAPAIANYDFGPAPDGDPAQGPRRALLVHDVDAPAWLDSPFIHYRLACQAPAPRPAHAVDLRALSPAGLARNR